LRIAQPGRPDPVKIEAWRRTYLEHTRHSTDPLRCAAPGCFGRFPCAYRMEAAELLITAGAGVPHKPG